MNTPYLDHLRMEMNKDAGFLSNLKMKYLLGNEFPRLALYHQTTGARQLEQIAKLKKNNKLLSVLGGAGGLALLLNALGAVDLGSVTGRGRQAPPAPTVIHY